MRNSGYCAIGQWKDNYTLHGYAKRTDKDRNVVVGLWEEANIFTNTTTKKDKITKYDPDNDTIARKIDFKKYDDS